jgi:hypothetical protein
VAAVHAIEDPDGQPGVFEMEGFKGKVMFHKQIIPAPRGVEAGMITLYVDV